MLLSDETSDDGELRIYFTRASTVISYFTEDDEGGVRTHVAPGEFAGLAGASPRQGMNPRPLRAFDGGALMPRLGTASDGRLRNHAHDRFETTRMTALQVSTSD